MKTFKVIVTDSMHTDFMTYMKVKKTTGTQVKLKGFETDKFFIHKTLNPGIWHGKYSLIHSETGLRICDDDSKKDIKGKGERLLNTKGRKLLDEAIEKRKLLFKEFNIKYPINK